MIEANTQFVVPFPQHLGPWLPTCSARGGQSRHQTHHAWLMELLVRRVQPGVPLLSTKPWSMSSFFRAPEQEDALRGSTILNNYFSVNALLCSLSLRCMSPHCVHK